MESDSDQEGFQPTQTEREIFHLLKENYGSLTKDIFKNELASAYNKADLQEYRQTLYDIAKVDLPNTPNAALIPRKDRAGGQPAKEKLAEDIYVLFHYLEGDNTILWTCVNYSVKKTDKS